MKKLFKLAFFVITIVLCTNQFCYAHKGKEHNKILERVLFGNAGRVSLNDIQKENLNAIESASYLCIDQCNRVGDTSLKKLHKIGVKNIINSIYEINYNTFGGDHRPYTHKGWNWPYPKDSNTPGTDISQETNWKRRKQILVNTCYKVCDFGFFSNIIINKKKRCDSFASLIFYIHLLGDYDEGLNKTNYTKKTLTEFSLNGMVPLYYNAKNPPENVIDGLKNCIVTLFSNQKNTQEYKNLISGYSSLDNLKDKLRFSSSYQDFKKIICIKLSNNEEDGLMIKLLEENIPKMLRREDFFNKAFY